MSNKRSDHIAAIDMGSNSFHMVIGRIFHGELQLLDKLAVKVQLGAGLGRGGELSISAQNKALDCLAMFKQRMFDIPKSNIRIVGTNALRKAKNRGEFIDRAEELLGQQVDIISGIEEARLIYLGVAHTLADDNENRLVVDIGGGSTELTIGRRFEPECLESLHLGCVTFKEKFFSAGHISTDDFEKAVLEARREVAKIERALIKVGWDEVVGSSGTARSVIQVLREQGLANESITLEGLETLSKTLISLGNIDQLSFSGLKEDRRSIFPSGCAILLGIFKQLKLKEMRFSEGALREGLLYDQLGRIQHEDVRDRTVKALQKRYYVDTLHAKQVEITALMFFDQVKVSWSLDRGLYREMLQRAVNLHQIGLAISHSQFHKHGGYLLYHSDLAGFSSIEQQVLSVLVRSHRRKLQLMAFDELYDAWYVPAQHLAILLRLAVVFNHSRDYEPSNRIKLSVKQNILSLSFPENWLKEHPLTHVELFQEQRYLEKAGYQLGIVH